MTTTPSTEQKTRTWGVFPNERYQGNHDFRAKKTTPESTQPSVPSTALSAISQGTSFLSAPTGTIQSRQTLSQNISSMHEQCALQAFIELHTPKEKTSKI